MYIQDFFIGYHSFLIHTDHWIESKPIQLETIYARMSQAYAACG